MNRQEDECGDYGESKRAAERKAAFIYRISRKSPTVAPSRHAAGNPDSRRDRRLRNGRQTTNCACDAANTSGTDFRVDFKWYRARTEGFYDRELQPLSGRTIDVASMFIARQSHWEAYHALAVSSAITVEELARIRSRAAYRMPIRVLRFGRCGNGCSGRSNPTSVTATRKLKRQQ